MDTGRKMMESKYSTFVPAPLPPKFDFTVRLVGILSEGDGGDGLRVTGDRRASLQ